MNERIRELMEEAGIYDFVVESMGINEEMEKFAELIVRECIEVVGDCSIEYATRPQIVDEIKQHFGVDGMSTEDKKTLIKELLGVKNETN